ncbi:MAG: hypothetical protein ACYCTF_09235 [Acidiferrobacter sp.]
MLLAFLIALIIITVIATFPTFWIRLLTERATRSRKPAGTDPQGPSGA